MAGSNVLNNLWQRNWERSVHLLVVRPLIKERDEIRERRLALLEAEGSREYCREVMKKAKKMKEVLEADKYQEIHVSALLNLGGLDYCNSDQMKEARNYVGDYRKDAPFWVRDGDEEADEHGFYNMYRVPHRLYDERQSVASQQYDDYAINSLEYIVEIKTHFLYGDHQESIRCPCADKIQMTEIPAVEIPWMTTENEENKKMRMISPYKNKWPVLEKITLRSCSTCQSNEAQHPHEVIQHMLYDEMTPNSHRACLAGLVRLAECFYEVSREDDDLPLVVPTLVSGLVRFEGQLCEKGILLDQEFVDRINGLMKKNKDAGRKRRRCS